ncbi:MAG: hypothetical protein RMI89_03910 [Gloeomargarita sp. SKYBB_i_bin120]|nr:hypothetical protein [Gloeomargarita sp. SKYG98]MCS7292103.1 hypothetical protein [Gloeomargarita sp. SKYB120]MDW8177663.1 hypothetical protein [Gloeomargarita sp. SKYBB_i_bin120]
MTERLTREQLNQLIAEVQRIADRQLDTIGLAQAREILRELNLPDDLLEEALLQIRRRQAAKQQQLLNRLVVGGVALFLAVAIGGYVYLERRKESLIANVRSQAAQVTLAQRPEQPVQVVMRPSEVVYRVTLVNAPVGQKLPMACDWVNPQGTVVHQNRYQTKQISTPLWNTRCRYRLSTADATGLWTVRMYVKDRLVSTTSFEVR